MKKFIIPFTAFVLAAVLSCGFMLQISAEGSSQAEADIPADVFVTYGYLEAVKEQMKQEILEELKNEIGSISATPYSDITATEGQFIHLSPNSELIYRGGGAVAITSSDIQGEGVTDMSAGTELFSGQPLEYGHIYYSSESESKKSVLITGTMAYFTVRGDYEIG